MLIDRPTAIQLQEVLTKSSWSLSATKDNNTKVLPNDIWNKIFKLLTFQNLVIARLTNRNFFIISMNAFWHEVEMRIYPISVLQGFKKSFIKIQSLPLLVVDNMGPDMIDTTIVDKIKQCPIPAFRIISREGKLALGFLIREQNKAEAFVSVIAEQERSTWRSFSTFKHPSLFNLGASFSKKAFIPTNVGSEICFKVTALLSGRAISIMLSDDEQPYSLFKSSVT